jgi:hypothetical protein
MDNFVDIKKCKYTSKFSFTTRALFSVPEIPDFFNGDFNVFWDLLQDPRLINC